MVGNPIYYYFKAHCMALLYQSFPIIHSSKFRIYCVVVCHGIITSQHAFSCFFTNRIYGHKPQRLNAHIFQALQVCSKGFKSAFRCVLPHIHFINISLHYPCGMAIYNSRVIYYYSIRCGIIFIIAGKKHIATQSSKDNRFKRCIQQFFTKVLESFFIANSFLKFRASFPLIQIGNEKIR